MPIRAFLSYLVRFSAGHITLNILFVLMLVSTYLLFPTVVNGYVLVFVGILWPAWMLSVVVAVIDRL